MLNNLCNKTFLIYQNEYKIRQIENIFLQFIFQFIESTVDLYLFKMYFSFFLSFYFSGAFNRMNQTTIIALNACSVPLFTTPDQSNAINFYCNYSTSYSLAPNMCEPNHLIVMYIVYVIFLRFWILILCWLPHCAVICKPI